MDAPYQNRDSAHATSLCICSTSPGHFCDPCFLRRLEQHQDTSSHPGLYQEVVVCSECNNKTATNFCVCEDSFPSVCTSCEKKHKEKDLVLHWLFKNEERRKVGTDEEKILAKNKVHYFISGRGMLARNLEKVRRCKEAVARNFTKMLGIFEKFLEEEKNREIRNLDAVEANLRREFDFAVQEVRSHLLDQNFNSESGISQALFNYNCLEDMESLNFFNFECGELKIDSDPLLGVKWECRLLEDRKVRKAWMKVGTRLLALPHMDNIFFYTPATKFKNKFMLSQSITKPEWSTWTFLPSGDVLVFGFYTGVGGAGTTEAIIITSSGECANTASLIAPRYGPGGCYFDNWVFCFGGYHNASLSSCEKYSLSARSWSSIPNMISGRHYFNTCEYRRLIYLCGGETLDSEVFYPSNGTFAALDFKLPLGSWVTSILHEGEIFIFTNTWVTKYDIASKQKKQINSGAGQFSIRCEPVIIDDIAFVIHTPPFGGPDGVRQLDLKTLFFKDNINLT